MHSCFVGRSEKSACQCALLCEHGSGLIWSPFVCAGGWCLLPALPIPLCAVVPLESFINVGKTSSRCLSLTFAPGLYSFSYLSFLSDIRQKCFNLMFSLIQLKIYERLLQSIFFSRVMFSDVAQVVKATYKNAILLVFLSPDFLLFSFS